MGVTRVVNEAWHWWEGCFGFMPYPRYVAIGACALVILAIGHVFKMIFDSK